MVVTMGTNSVVKLQAEPVWVLRKKKKKANDIFKNSILFGERLKTNPLWNSDEFLAYLLVSSSLSHNYPEDL